MLPNRSTLISRVTELPRGPVTVVSRSKTCARRLNGAAQAKSPSRREPEEIPCSWPSLPRRGCGGLDTLRGAGLTPRRDAADPAGGDSPGGSGFGNPRSERAPSSRRSSDRTPIRPGVSMPAMPRKCLGRDNPTFPNRGITVKMRKVGKPSRLRQPIPPDVMGCAQAVAPGLRLRMARDGTPDHFQGRRRSPSLRYRSRVWRKSSAARASAPLDVSQPDPNLPDRLLATCPDCLTWYLVETTSDQGDGVGRARWQPLIGLARPRISGRRRPDRLAILLPLSPTLSLAATRALPLGLRRGAAAARASRRGRGRGGRGDGGGADRARDVGRGRAPARGGRRRPGRS